MGLSDKRKKYEREYMKRYRKQNKSHIDYKKFYQIKYKFGLSKEEYNLILNKQNNKCAICLSSLDLWRKTHLDHNHITNEVRGILCSNCNSLLGHCKENNFILKSAINYLETYSKDKQNNKLNDNSKRENITSCLCLS